MKLQKVALTLPQAHQLVVEVLDRSDFPRATVLDRLAYYQRRNRISRLSREKKNRLKYDVPRAGRVPSLPFGPFRILSGPIHGFGHSSCVFIPKKVRIRIRSVQFLFSKFSSHGLPDSRRKGKVRYRIPVCSCPEAWLPKNCWGSVVICRCKASTTSRRNYQKSRL